MWEELEGASETLAGAFGVAVEVGVLPVMAATGVVLRLAVRL